MTQNEMLQKLTSAAASGIDWRPFLQTVREACTTTGAAHSEIVTGQLLTAAVALFDDGTLTDTQRRDVWTALTSIAWDVTAQAHRAGALALSPSEPRQ